MRCSTLLRRRWCRAAGAVRVTPGCCASSLVSPSSSRWVSSSSRGTRSAATSSAVRSESSMRTAERDALVGSACRSRNRRMGTLTRGSLHGFGRGNGARERITPRSAKSTQAGWLPAAVESASTSATKPSRPAASGMRKRSLGESSRSSTSSPMCSGTGTSSAHSRTRRSSSGSARPRKRRKESNPVRRRMVTRMPGRAPASAGATRSAARWLRPAPVSCKVSPGPGGSSRSLV